MANQWMCVFVYTVDTASEPAIDRRAMSFTEAYLGQVDVSDFRKNARGELGTRPATLHAAERLARRDSPEASGSPASKVVLDASIDRLSKHQPRLPHRARHHAHIAELHVSCFRTIATPHRHHHADDLASALQTRA